MLHIVSRLSANDQRYIHTADDDIYILIFGDGYTEAVADHLKRITPPHPTPPRPARLPTEYAP